MANDGNQVEPTPQIEESQPQISGEQGGQGLSQASGQSADLSEIKDYIQKEIQSLKDVRFGIGVIYHRQRLWHISRS